MITLTKGNDYTDIMTGQHDDAIGFVMGDVLASVMLWVHFDVAAFEVKLIMTIGFGLIGGAAGLAGKDLYVWLKKKIL